MKRRRDQKKKCAIKGAIPRCKYGSSLTSGAAASLVKRLSVCVMRSKTKKKRLKTQCVRVHERDQSLLALRRDQHKLRVAAAADAAELNHSSHMVHSKQEGFFSFFLFPAAAVRLDFPRASHAFTLTLLFFRFLPVVTCTAEACLVVSGRSLSQSAAKALLDLAAIYNPAVC